MTYAILSAAFLAVAVVVLLIALARRPDRRGLIARWWLPVLCAGVVLTVLTAVFDNLMIRSGFMVYSSARTSGLLVGRAPLEDFSYPLAALILLPALWSLLRRGRRR
jgi:lycopene cyclase domain-containing protein